jgi:hypothetical protein
MASTTDKKTKTVKSEVADKTVEKKTEVTPKKTEAKAKKVTETKPKKATDTKSKKATDTKSKKSTDTKSKKSADKKKVAKDKTPTEEREKGKRSFKVIYEDPEGVVIMGGRFCGIKPKQAACKALTGIYKIFKKANAKVSDDIKFGVYETTRGSKNKRYWYSGEKAKLETPIKLYQIPSDDDTKKKYCSAEKIEADFGGFEKVFKMKEKSVKPSIIYNFTNKVKKVKPADCEHLQKVQKVVDEEEDDDVTVSTKKSVASKKSSEKTPKKVSKKTEEEPKKKVTKKTEEKAEEPKKKVTKKVEEKTVEEPKKKVTKKAEEKPAEKVVEEPKKKTVTKKTESEPEPEAKPAKKTAKK